MSIQSTKLTQSKFEDTLQTFSNKAMRDGTDSFSFSAQKEFFDKNPGVLNDLIEKMKTFVEDHLHLMVPATLQIPCHHKQETGKCFYKSIYKEPCKFAHNWVSYFVGNLLRNSKFKLVPCRDEGRAVGCTRKQCDFQHKDDPDFHKKAQKIVPAQRKTQLTQMQPKTVKIDMGRFELLGTDDDSGSDCSSPKNDTPRAGAFEKDASSNDKNSAFLTPRFITQPSTRAPSVAGSDHSREVDLPGTPLSMSSLRSVTPVQLHFSSALSFNDTTLSPAYLASPALSSTSSMYGLLPKSLLSIPGTPEENSAYRLMQSRPSPTPFHLDSSPATGPQREDAGFFSDSEASELEELEPSHLKPFDNLDEPNRAQTPESSTHRIAQRQLSPFHSKNPGYFSDGEASELEELEQPNALTAIQNFDVPRGTVEQQMKEANRNLPEFYKRIEQIQVLFDRCIAENRLPNDLYKTTFCRNLEKSGKCSYEKACAYAHDLATYYMRNNASGKFKRVECDYDQTLKGCLKGISCTFLHKADAPPPPPKPRTPWNPKPASMDNWRRTK